MRSSDDSSQVDLAGLDLRAVERLLNGEGSPSDGASLERWIAGDPKRRLAIAALEQVLRTGSGSRDVAAAWTRVASRAGLSTRPDDRVGTTAASDAGAGRQSAARRLDRSDPVIASIRTPSWPANVAAGRRPQRAVAVAASVAAIAVLAWGSTLIARRTGAVASVATRDVSTARGQRATVHLADGSTILLDVDSRLTFPVAFGAGARDVSLEGAAYFEVAHDPSRPFRVHANGAVARVLGTQFGVWAYPASPVRVAVLSGRVSLATANEAGAPGSGTATAPVLLTAGMAGEVGPAGARQVSNVNVADALAWKDGHLKFTHARLRDVVPQLERWYDLTIVVPGRVQDSYELTASFGEESPEEALDVLSAAIGLPYSIDGRSVQFVDALTGHGHQTRDSSR